MSFGCAWATASRSYLRDVVAPQANKAQVAVCGCTAEGLTLSDGIEILDAGAVSNLNPDVPQCRVPFNPEPRVTTGSQTLSPRFSLVFRNSCTSTRVRLDWVRYDGGLRPTAELEPGEELDQTSFVGHQWRVRDGITGRWIRDFALDGGSPVDLCACEPGNQP